QRRRTGVREGVSLGGDAEGSATLALRSETERRPDAQIVNWRQQKSRDEIITVRRAPARAEIIAGNRLIFDWTGAVGVAAGCNVVEAGVVAGAFSNGVKSRIGKPDGGQAFGGGLFIRQGY